MLSLVEILGEYILHIHQYPLLQDSGKLLQHFAGTTVSDDTKKAILRLQNLAKEGRLLECDIDSCTSFGNDSNGVVMGKQDARDLLSKANNLLKSIRESIAVLQAILKLNKSKAA